MWNNSKGDVSHPHTTTPQLSPPATRGQSTALLDLKVRPDNELSRHCITTHGPQPTRCGIQPATFYTTYSQHSGMPSLLRACDAGMSNLDHKQYNCGLPKPVATWRLIKPINTHRSNRPKVWVWYLQIRNDHRINHCGKHHQAKHLTPCHTHDN